ncbi:MAG: radical SAM protein, partial [Myxococcales bacterium]|nr:radical SAM protein [Myxococcales bacterium]
MSRPRPTLRDARLAARLAAAALDPDRPIITHLVVTRRCNLSCGYCFEYDKVSPPVPRDVLEARIDHLARLGSIFVTLTGGEALLHPDLVALVRHVRARGMVPLLNTNGYLLTRAVIEALNDAGLWGLQLSIDNARPDAVSKKSLKPLLPKLRLLARHAGFHVRVNTVLGTGAPDEALAVARTVVGFGFAANCSLVRDARGELIPPDAATRAAYDQIRRLGRRLPAFLDDDFTRELLDRGEMRWKCRAGARTFMVCEDGLVHLCQPRMGEPGTPLAAYTVADIRRAFAAPKPCAARCPIAFAHHASKLDRWRAQDGAPLAIAPAAPAAEA